MMQYHAACWGNRNLDQYQFTVRPLSEEEGGGYLVEYPDIP